MGQFVIFAYETFLFQELKMFYKTIPKPHANGMGAVPQVGKIIKNRPESTLGLALAHSKMATLVTNQPIKFLFK